MGNLLQAKASIQITKTLQEVFEAIANPKQMSNYFISFGSDRIEEEGKEVMWGFPEFSETFPIRIGKVVKNEFLSFYWEVNDKEHLVEIKLSPYKDSTIVSVTETGEENTEAGIKWLKENTEGWANFLACLKAWVEYGIKLRVKAFDYRFDKEYK